MRVRVHEWSLKDAEGAALLGNMRAGVRPVPLEIHIQGFDIHNFEARMQVCGCVCAQIRVLLCLCWYINMRSEGGKPALRNTC